jgi:hypothetical protein
MTPEEYEHLVAEVLRSEGWVAHVTPYVRDYGLDVIAERDGRRLGVQAKMYGGANRSISIETVMLTYAAAAYADCGEAMIVTDGHVLDDARQVADKLRVAIRVVSAIASLTAAPPVARDRQPDRHVLSFGEIWDTHFVPLAGRVLIRPNGTTNEILKVDHAGLVRRTSNGRTQTIKIEIFRWTVEKLLRGETVSRDEINQHYPGRASSGIALIVSSIPIFDTISVAGRQAMRLRAPL